MTFNLYSPTNLSGQAGCISVLTLRLILWFSHCFQASWVNVSVYRELTKHESNLIVERHQSEEGKINYTALYLSWNTMKTKMGPQWRCKTCSITEGAARTSVKQWQPSPLSFISLDCGGCVKEGSLFDQRKTSKPGYSWHKNTVSLPKTFWSNETEVQLFGHISIGHRYFSLCIAWTCHHIRMIWFCVRNTPTAQLKSSVQTTRVSKI